MKKLLLLGGDFLLLPVIKLAKQYGCYVITCDYLPDNIAHKFSDEYINYSTTDKEGILEWAKSNNISGVLTFTDSGALTAAYVAEKLGLPYQCSYHAAEVLQDKNLFRQFLKENGFKCPFAKGYNNVEDAIKDSQSFDYPIIVKPVDSAGSKGVSKVNSSDCLEPAIANALSFSNKKQFIIEKFLEKQGFSCGSESFAVDGKLMFNGIYDQYFDKEAHNEFIPSAEVWPSILENKYQEEMKSELQRLFTLLGITTGLFNIEFRLCTDGKLYLMEVSPRAGGNRLAEMLRIATGQDIIDAEVRKALGLPVKQLSEPVYSQTYAIFVLHSVDGGYFESLAIDETFELEHVIDKMIIKKRGDQVSAFKGANAAIGTLFLKFETRKELSVALDNPSNWCQIEVE